MLAFFAVTAAALIGLMGVAIYTGLQAYFQNEVTKTAHTAAMAGAASYYSGQGARIAPVADTGYATGVSNAVFNTIRTNSPAMQSFNAALSTPPAAANNIVTVGVRGTFPTPLLALVGTSEVEVNGVARAQAVRYVPTNQSGVVRLKANGAGGLPPGSGMNGFEYRIDPLRFPTIEGRGTELVIYQSLADNNTVQQGYSVQACNATTCYNISRNAVLMPGSRRSVNNQDVIYGGCRVDLEEARVNKATSIRITDDGIYDAYYGDRHFIYTDGLVENVLERIEIYGYASACPVAGACPVPAGFEAI